MTKKLFITAATILFMVSCVTEQEPKSKENTVSAKTAEVQSIDVRDLFYAIPSPLELSVLFLNAGVEYDKEQLLNVEEAYKYESSEHQALLLGIYGADLSYSCIFKRPQQAIKYMAACKELAEKLSIGQGFDEQMMQRVEANIQNRDSIILIVANTFLDVNSYLKENKQNENSTLVLIGGWIEGLYLGTSMIRTAENNSELKEIIKSQRVSLTNLIALSEKSDLKSQTWIVPKLKELLQLFEIKDNIDIETTISQNEETLTISSNENSEISDENFNTLNNQVSELRSRIIKP